MSDEIAGWIKENRRETMELKPCWKCGKEAMTWSTDRWAPKGSVTCPDDDCMEDSEYYTVEEWQNHPRLGDAICKASMFATINIKGYDAIRERINQGIKECIEQASKTTFHVLSASASPDCKITVKKKRKSWIEKIREKLAYELDIRTFNLNARVQSAEAMRDHYKTVFSETRNELVKQRSIINENNKILGRRLKFSVGHNHIEIIVGNPVTACYFTERKPDKKPDDYEDAFLDIAVCHKNDTYDWKRGVVESLENMVKNWLGSAYGDPAEYFNTLFTIYPELGIQPAEVKKTKKVKRVSKE